MTGVELLVGGWFASPVIKTVSEKAQKYLEANWGLQKDAQEMVEDLTRKLRLCEGALIEVQEEEIINNRALADWLRKLKETVYDAEDVLDNMEAKSIKEGVQGKNKVSKIASSSLSTVRNMLIPADILKSLQKVTDELNKCFSELSEFIHLVNQNEKKESRNHKVNGPRETISSLFGVLYGREKELDLILSIILGSDSESSKKGRHVIPIVGMGGVGKTALAQAVCSNSEVKTTFKNLWISVSNKPLVDVKLVLLRIYRSLGYSGPDSISLDEIFTNITSRIPGVGKFLIVLDDMFEMNNEGWELLSATLLHCDPGSVVLITTQNQVFANWVVANTVGAVGRPIALSTLNSDIFWELFEHFACGNKEIRTEQSILKGKKIADKLRGLPLAAKIIGNQLRTHGDVESWRENLNSEWWEWVIPEDKSRILQSIGLNYKQLDPRLRQCFAYCSVFPRNSLIKKDRLVHMWIAQNFIPSDVHGGKKLDIGRQWFDELVKKSFFQHAPDNNSYVMHDLMHDLAVIVSSGECFYLGEGLVEIPSGVWHLAVDTHNLEVIKRIRTHKNLRSFLYFKRSQVEGMYSAINEMLDSLDGIRILDLSFMCMEKEKKPPTNIWKLQHLRFLDLSSTGIERLTTSSIGLYHLQALYIEKCKISELPRGINKLINLHHFCDDEFTQISDSSQLTILQKLKVLFVRKKPLPGTTELRNL